MGATSTDPENVTSLKYLLNDATQGIPGTFAVAIQASIFDVGDSFGSSVEMNISGPQYEKVRRAAAAMQGMVMQQLNLFAVPNPQNFALGRDETQIVPDRIRAASAGVSTSSIRRAAQVAVDGEIIGNYREGAKSIDLTVMAQQRATGNVEALRDVPLATRDGRITMLATVANFVQTEAPQRIRRIEEQPAITLSLQMPPNLTVQEMENALWSSVIAPLQQQGVITPDLTVRTSGSAAKLSQFTRAFLPGFVLAAAITYLLLAALFESWLHPFVIIMSVPFALVGGFGGLWILHQTSGVLLDVLTMLGFVILVGTIVNNPILIVYQALHYMRDRDGPPARHRPEHTDARQADLHERDYLGGRDGAAGAARRRGIGTLSRPWRGRHWRVAREYGVYALPHAHADEPGAGHPGGNQAVVRPQQWPPTVWSRRRRSARDTLSRHDRYLCPWTVILLSLPLRPACASPPPLPPSQGEGGTRRCAQRFCTPPKPHGPGDAIFVEMLCAPRGGWCTMPARLIPLGWRWPAIPAYHHPGPLHSPAQSGGALSGGGFSLPA